MTTGIKPSRSLQTRAIRAGAWLARRKFTAGTLVAVSNRDHILMVEMHRDRGRWGLPGGFFKPGESPADAGAREVKEEVGIEIALSDSDFIAAYPQPWASHIDFLYKVAIDGQPGPKDRSWSEIKNAAWIDVTSSTPVELTIETQLALPWLGYQEQGDATYARH